MALLTLQIIPCDSFSRGLQITVDTTEIITVGDVYTFSATTNCGDESNPKPCFPFGCYVVEDIFIPKPGQLTTAELINSYGTGSVGCENCTIANSNFLVFQSCFDGFNTFYIPINQITPTPTIDEVYFLDFYLGSYGLTFTQQGCYTLIGFSFFSRQEQEILVTNYSNQTDCQSCINNSPIVYDVTDCVTNNSVYISLPSSNLQNHLITYTGLDGLTQYCGIVKESSTNTPDAIFVTDLGVFDEKIGIDCDYCLSFNNEKRLLVNCLDNTTEIVWASNLFDVGNSTHLSIGNGCYEVSGVADPMSAITINELANYDPQKDCEDCLECYGVIYDYITCEPVEVCGPINLINTVNVGLYGGRDFKIDSSNFAFIPFRDSNRIGKIDLTTLSVVEQSGSVLYGPVSLDIDETNGVICVSNNNTFLSPNYYVTFFDYNDLNSYFTTSITGARPNKVYLNPNDGFFYVTTTNLGFSVDSIYVFSGLSYSGMNLVGSFGQQNTDYTDIIEIGGVIYVLNKGAQSISRYNNASGGWSFIANDFLGNTLESFTYNPSNNILYISASNGSVYIKYNILTNNFSLISFSISCFGCLNKIKYNSTTNRLYITDSCCNHIYEFDTNTDTLLKTYSNELINYGINQVYGIDTNSLGETWFSSYYQTFELGCTSDFITGQTTSNELIQTGETFFNPILSACCEVTGVQSITSTDSYFFGLTEYPSIINYQDCQTCTGTTHQVFYCQSCDGFSDGILVSTGSTYQIGDFVRSHWGNSDWVCFEIVDYYDPVVYGETYVFEANQEIYSTCEECTSGATIGLTVINCDTLIPEQVNVSLSNWIEITGFPFGLGNSVISDSNGVCYQVVKPCPIDNVNPLFEPKTFYINQFFCRLGERTLPPPYSAGTEYTTCVICCPCESGSTVTTVSVPHPIWTGIQGNAVTLLDAVQLGGMNGLNS